MRAALVSDYERPPATGDFDDPEATDGNVVVDVSVAGINPIDIRTAAGLLPDRPPLPSVAGREGIGEVGGRRVYFDSAVPPHGSIAERALVDPDSLIDVPEGAPDALAVAFGIAGLAGWLGLEWRGGLQAGETVLVLGASGLVGQVAVQAARLLGAARVVAAARDEELLRHARDELGADAVVALDSGEGLADRFTDAAEGPIDLVIDPIWGPAAQAALDALGDRGRLVQIGNSAAATAEVSARPLRAGMKAILGHINFLAPQEVKAEAFQRMCRHAAAGELSVEVEELPLDQVAEAWRRQRESPHRKLVIRLR